MSEMVERVADHLRLCGLDKNAEYFARKAIEAMREPTLGMVEAGFAVLEDLDGVVMKSALVQRVCQAMIDEALK